MSAAPSLHVVESRGTDFPKKGDDKKVGLRNSQWRTFDPDFAEMLREDYPAIWSKGGNEVGNAQYRRLKPVVNNGGTPKTDAQEQAVRLREAWGSRHKGNKLLAGVVAQVKWFVVGSRGEGYMKRLLREAMKREDERRAKAVAPHLARVGVTMRPPPDVVELAAEALANRKPGDASLVTLEAAYRVADAMPTTADLRRMVEDESRWTGGALGAAWASAELARIAAAHPLRFMVPTVDRADTTTDQGRALWWASWDRDLRRPSERRLRIEVGEWLRQWRDGIAERVPDVMGDILPSESRDLVDDLLIALLEDEAAAAALRERLGPVVERVLRQSFRRTVADMAVSGLSWEPSISTVDQPIAQLVTRVTDTTRERLARIIRDAIAEGITPRDMQKRIMAHPDFGRARALTIARTETGKLLTAGTNKAIEDARAMGVDVRRQWITARFAVRPTHQPMDGRTVAPGEPWVLPGDPANKVPSATTQGPGLSGVASQDINCRCAVRPVVNFNGGDA